MGERAQAFCWNGDSQSPCWKSGQAYEVYTSQWAGREGVLNRVLAADSVDTQTAVLGACDWQFVARRERETAVAAIDYLGTAVIYSICPDGVRVWLPLWVGLPLIDGPTEPTLGVCAKIEDSREYRWLRRECQQVKGALQDAVAAGVISAKTAIRVLMVWVTAWNRRRI